MTRFALSTIIPYAMLMVLALCMATGSAFTNTDGTGAEGLAAIDGPMAVSDRTASTGSTLDRKAAIAS